MKTFKSILFVSRGTEDAEANLKQILHLAKGSGADLSVLIIYPLLPESLVQYQDKWRESLIREMREAVARAGTAELEITAASADLPGEVIIQQVLHNGYDLVFKEAEPLSGGVGHKALDMELLRKCPCPVWLARQPGKAGDMGRVAVAIDPDNREPAARDLAIRLLKKAGSLATLCRSELQIVSCWDCEFESFLLHNPFTSIPVDEVARTVTTWERAHSKALTGLIAAAGFTGNYRVHHIRGQAEDMIPGFVERESIDILVMGTVARTGIPGFIMGNTAENIVQKLQCSLLALKPAGFVSPVKAY